MGPQIITDVDFADDTALMFIIRPFFKLENNTKGTGLACTSRHANQVVAKLFPGLSRHLSNFREILTLDPGIHLTELILLPFLYSPLDN